VVRSRTSATILERERHTAWVQRVVAS
jgi:hypothetical protein